MRGAPQGALNRNAGPNPAKEETIMDTWYTYGSTYVCVRSGMPEQTIEIGVGDDYDEALESLEATPMQSTGRDCGISSALKWAQHAGWIDDVNDLIDDDGPDAD